MKKLFPIIAVLAFVLLPAWSRADSDWKASVSVSEEYNDNVREQKHGKGDYVTSIKPSIGFRSEGSRFLFETDNSVLYRNYAQGNKGDEFINNLKGRGVLTAVENFLFIEVSDQYRTTYTDTTRSSLDSNDAGTVDPVTGEPIAGALNYNDTSTGLINQNTFSVSPYTTVRLGDRGNVTTGYRYQEITYDKVGQDKTNQTAYSDLSYELTDVWNLLGGGSYQRQDTRSSGLDREILYVGSSYSYAEGSSVFGKIGPSFTQYDQGGETVTTFWNAGVTHSFGTVVANFNTSVSYDEDPRTNESLKKTLYSGRLTKLFERTKASVYTNYAQYEGRSTGNTDRTTVGLNIERELTTRLSGNFDVSRDLTEQSGGETERWYTGVGLRYLLAENITGELWYRYKDSSTRSVTGNSYNVNRVGFQLTGTF